MTYLHATITGNDNKVSFNVHQIVAVQESTNATTTIWVTGAGDGEFVINLPYQKVLESLPTP